MHFDSESKHCIFLHEIKMGKFQFRHFNVLFVTNKTQKRESKYSDRFSGNVLGHHVCV